MNTDKVVKRTAIGFFVFWLLVLLAGADFPPPNGFVWVIFLVIVAALAVYFRMPMYIDWIVTKKRYRLLRVIIDGILVGLIFAGLTLLVSSGEPSIEPRLIDRVIWFVVLGIVGVFNTLLVYLFSYAINRFSTR